METAHKMFMVPVAISVQNVLPYMKILVECFATESVLDGNAYNGSINGWKIVSTSLRLC